jgi:tetratricopeptide (TPR) repeat protein
MNTRGRLALLPVSFEPGGESPLTETAHSRVPGGQVRVGKAQAGERAGRIGLYRINLDLRYVAYPLFLVSLFTAPLMRGLFFAADLLPYMLVFSVVMLLAASHVILRNEQVFRGPLAPAFLCLALSYGASFFVAASRPEAFRGFLRYLTYFGVFWLATYVSRGRKGRRWLALAVFWSATVLGVVGILSATGLLAFPGASLGGRIMSTLQYPNALAAYLIFSSVIGLSLASTEGNPVLRTVFSLAAFSQALVFLSSYSRGGWVIFPVAVLLMFLGMPQAQRSRLAFHTCTALTAVLLVVRRFSEAVEGKTPRGAVKYVLFGLMITLLFEVGYSVFRRVAGDLLSRPVRRVLAWAGVAYAAVTLIAYVVALAGQYSAGVAGMVSASMLHRFTSINANDPSLITRAFATGDALRMFLAHPLFGGGAGAWNAWYHQYQKVLYWTTEVHNQYAQVLVETGILGFSAYLFIWGALMFYVVRFMLRAREKGLWEDSRAVALTWGMFAACLAVGLHSFMDFEMSLPGVAVQVWAVMGAVYESTLNPETLEGRRTRKPARAEPPSGQVDGPIAGAVVALLSVVLLASSYTMQRGAYYGRLGASALSSQDFYIAVKSYQQASRFDPLSASYSMDAGQAYAAMALLEKRDDLRERALAEFEKARLLEPFNLSHRLKEIETLVSLGETGNALEISRGVMNSVPLDVTAYEPFARLCVMSYMRAAKGSRADDGGDAATLLLAETSLLDEVTAIPSRLEQMAESITGGYREMWDPKKLEPTFSLNTYIGQAYYLRGDLDRAGAFFDKALASSVKPAEAQVWDAAVHVLKGQATITDASGDVLEVISYFHPTPG